MKTMGVGFSSSSVCFMFCFLGFSMLLDSILFYTKTFFFGIFLGLFMAFAACRFSRLMSWELPSLGFA